MVGNVVSTTGQKGFLIASIACGAHEKRCVAAYQLE